MADAVNQQQPQAAAQPVPPVQTAEEKLEVIYLSFVIVSYFFCLTRWHVVFGFIYGMTLTAWDRLMTANNCVILYTNHNPTMWLNHYALHTFSVHSPLIIKICVTPSQCHLVSPRFNFSLTSAHTISKGLTRYHTQGQVLKVSEFMEKI